MLENEVTEQEFSLMVDEKLGELPFPVSGEKMRVSRVFKRGRLRRVEVMNYNRDAPDTGKGASDEPIG